MDNYQGQEEKEGLEVNAPPPRDGLRRSRRLHNQLSPPTGTGGESERKRPRRQAEGKGPRNEVGDDGNSKVNAGEASVAEGDEEKTEDTDTGERSLRQPPRVEREKVGGPGSNLKVEDGASSAGNVGSGRSRSEVGSSEYAPMEEEWTPPLENPSSLISKGPNGNDQVAVGGGADDNVRGMAGASPVLEPPAALQNSVVLTNLFELCPPAYLAKFRLVCEEWRDLSLKTWRESATLKLRRNPDNGRFYINGGTTLFKFLKYVEDPGKECRVKPFRRIKLGGLILNHHRSPQMERFFTLTGRNVTSLDLRDCRFSDLEEFWRIPYSFFPNLKRLSLWFCSFGSRQNVSHSDEPQLKYMEPVRGKHGQLKCLAIIFSQLPVSWLELLSHFDSLTSLEVTAVRPTVCESLLNAIKAIRKHDGNKLPPKNFKVEPFPLTQDRASQDKFALLQEFDIPLKSLNVRAHPDLNLEVLSDILEAHSGSLEYLVLEDIEAFRESGWMEGKFQCRVPLEKLKNLNIHNVLLESTEILKSVPNLEGLGIVCQFGQVDRLNSMFGTLADWQADHAVAMLPKLTRLSYAGCFGARGNLATLARLMPNVEELEMTLNDEDFSTVCEVWKGLKTLSVESLWQDDANHLTDKGLTGGSLQIEMPEMKWIHQAVRPNITDLKELRSFKCDSNKLTDISVYHGFLQLPNLQSVTLLAEDDSDDEDDENPRVNPKANCFGQDARNELQKKGISLKF